MTLRQAMCTVEQCARPAAHKAVNLWPRVPEAKWYNVLRVVASLRTDTGLDEAKWAIDEALGGPQWLSHMPVIYKYPI